MMIKSRCCLDTENRFVVVKGMEREGRVRVGVLDYQMETSI